MSISGVNGATLILDRESQRTGSSGNDGQNGAPFLGNDRQRVTTDGDENEEPKKGRGNCRTPTRGRDLQLKAEVDPNIESSDTI